MLGFVALFLRVSYWAAMLGSIFRLIVGAKNHFNLHEAGDFGVVLISFNFVLFCSYRVEITLDDNIK